MSNDLGFLSVKAVVVWYVLQLNFGDFCLKLFVTYDLVLFLNLEIMDLKNF